MWPDTGKHCLECLYIFSIKTKSKEKLNYNSCTNLLLRKSQNLLFLAPEVQWALKVYRVCSIHIFFKCFQPRPYRFEEMYNISKLTDV